LVVFFAVVLLAAAFLPVPRCAGVAFFGEVAFWTRPTVRFTAEAIFLPARPVVPFAGVDLAVLFAAAVRLAAALFAGLLRAVVAFAVVRLVAGAVDFFAGAVLRAVVVLRAAVDFAAGLVFAVVFFAVDFFAAVVPVFFAEVTLDLLVAVADFAAGLVFFAVPAFFAVPVFFAAGLVFFAAGLVFFAAPAFFAAGLVFFAVPARLVAGFAAVVEVRLAALVDLVEVALDEVPVLDARRVAGRVVALVPTTISFSSLRTFCGFVPFGDNGVSRIRPRYGRTD
jgi:hypothetical protein